MSRIEAIVSGLAGPLLQFRLGGGLASYLLLTAKTIDANQAQAWGLCHELVSEAVRRARDAAQAGDVVLFSPACASFDQFRDYEKRGEHFRQLVGVIAESGVDCSADPSIGSDRV